MLKTYDMSIDDLTHICLWSKKQIDDCDRYKSAECPLAKHDVELLDKVADMVLSLPKKYIDNFDYVACALILNGLEELKAEVEE